MHDYVTVSPAIASEPTAQSSVHGTTVLLLMISCKFQQPGESVKTGEAGEAGEASAGGEAGGSGTEVKSKKPATEQSGGIITI